jgi:rhamnogalacturonan hydrolase
MLSQLVSALLVPAFLFSTLVHAEVDLTAVGPSTPLSAKTKICNVLNYGAVADNSTDIGPAILSAFTSCAKAGGATIYVPPGSYSSQSSCIISSNATDWISCHGDNS